MATKLHRPAVPATWVRRPGLIRRLDEGLARGRQVTLVSAPAGYGKTTCASAWLDTLGRPSAWLSLDPADDDPGRFLTYLLAALQKVRPGLGKEIAGALRSGRLPPCEAVCTALINGILESEERFLLVLDDLQAIQDPYVLQILERLATNPLPPLHLVLLTREDPSLPLARLRANNRLTEIRAQDLRFTREDAGRFLNEAMGLGLSPGDIDALEDKTEGWIAGLQLAALAMQSLSAGERSGPSAFISALDSHRFILDYLAEQVLDRQPEEIRRFLLKTSVLDKLHGGLCDAVTGRSDGRAMLERLHRANLFLVPLDDRGEWFRYHHLFADLLRRVHGSLDKEDASELHRRAGRWYASAGGEFTGEAVRHALAAEDHALAVELLEEHAMDLIMRGYARTVHGWMEALPAEWEARSFRTNLALAWMHALRGAYAEVSAYLERLEAALADAAAGPRPAEEDTSLSASCLVIRSLMLYMEDKTAESRRLASRALETAPAGDDATRSLAYYAMANAGWLAEEYQAAVEAFQSSIRHGRAAGNLVAEMMSTSSLARMALERGRLRTAFEIASPAAARAERSGAPPPIIALVHGALGEVLYQWYRGEEARRHTLRALQLCALGGYRSGMIGCRVLLSRLSLLEGDPEAAAREIREAVDRLQADTPGYVRQETVAQQVRVFLARNLLDAAEMALQGEGFPLRDGLSFPVFQAGRGLSYAAGMLYNGGLGFLLRWVRAGGGSAGLSRGIAMADRLVEGASRGECLPVALEALLLRAQMQEMLGNHQAGRDDYIRALELAAPEGFIGVFLEQGHPVAAVLAGLARRNPPEAAGADHLERILAAFAAPAGRPIPQPSAGAAPPEMIEPLTGRELEVLRQMAGGLKYEEIAARLFISVNTVRFHVKAVYGKLGVNNRTQAVEQTRRYRLL